MRSASSKTKRTNEYLNLFALAYDGKKLSKQFSAQRKWLVDVYTEYEHISDREEFIRQMGDTATYCSKLIYSSKKDDKLSALKQEADNFGVKLNTNAIKLLQNTSYKHHIEAIVQLGTSSKWDKAFVEKRTERICDILWKRMYEWLS